MNTSRRTKRNSPRGFTLMELLLALVLTGMIMSAAFSAVHLSWKYRSAGHIQVEQSQTVRGLLQDITLDLRSTAIPVRPMTADEQVGGIDGLSESAAVMFRQLVRDEVKTDESFGPQIEERVLDFDSIDKVDPINFYGESDFMVMLSTSKNYRFAGTVQPSDSPMSHVVWSASKGNTLRIPFAIRNDRLDYTTVVAQSDQSGLIRLQKQITSTNSDARQKPQFNAIVPDAIDVSFRYSNGVEWLTKWNSHAEKQLPTAVELTFARAPKAESQRFVIRLPQSGGTRRAAR